MASRSTTILDYVNTLQQQVTTMDTKQLEYHFGYLLQSEVDNFWEESSLKSALISFLSTLNVNELCNLMTSIYIDQLLCPSIKKLALYVMIVSVLKGKKRGGLVLSRLRSIKILILFDVMVGQLTIFDKVLFLEHIQMKLNEEQVRELLCLSHDNFDSNFVVDYQRISEILGIERFSWRTFREHPLIESLFIRLTTLNVWTNFSFQFLVSHRFAHHTQLFGKALFTNDSEERRKVFLDDILQHSSNPKKVMFRFLDVYHFNEQSEMVDSTSILKLIVKLLVETSYEYSKKFIHWIVEYDSQQKEFCIIDQILKIIEDQKKNVIDILKQSKMSSDNTFTYQDVDADIRLIQQQFHLNKLSRKLRFLSYLKMAQTNPKDPFNEHLFDQHIHFRDDSFIYWCTFPTQALPLSSLSIEWLNQFVEKIKQTYSLSNIEEDKLPLLSSSLITLLTEILDAYLTKGALRVFISKSPTIVKCLFYNLFVYHDSVLISCDRPQDLLDRIDIDAKSNFNQESMKRKMQLSYPLLCALLEDPIGLQLCYETFSNKKMSFLTVTQTISTSLAQKLIGTNRNQIFHSKTIARILSFIYPFLRMNDNMKRAFSTLIEISSPLHFGLSFDIYEITLCFLHCIHEIRKTIKKSINSQIREEILPHSDFLLLLFHGLEFLTLFDPKETTRAFNEWRSPNVKSKSNLNPFIPPFWELNVYKLFHLFVNVEKTNTLPSQSFSEYQFPTLSSVCCSILSVVDRIIANIRTHLKSTVHLGFWMFTKWVILLKEYHSSQQLFTPTLIQQRTTNNEKKQNPNDFVFLLARYIISFLNISLRNNNMLNSKDENLKWLHQLNKQEIVSFLKEMTSCSLHSEFTKLTLSKNDTTNIFDLILLLFDALYYSLISDKKDKDENLEFWKEYFDCVIVLIEMRSSMETTTKNNSTLQIGCRQFVQKIMNFWKRFPLLLPDCLRLFEALAQHLEFLEPIISERPFHFLVDLINAQNEINLSNQNKHQIFLGMSVLMTKCKGTSVQSLMLEQCTNANIIGTVITHGFKNDIDIANQCLYILQFLSCENPSFIDTIFCREQHFLTILLQNPQNFFIGLAKSDAIKRLFHLLYTALNEKRHCDIFSENLENHRGLVQLCHTFLTLPLTVLTSQTIRYILQPVAKCFKYPQFIFYMTKFNFVSILGQLLENKSQLGIDEKLEKSMAQLKQAILIEQDKLNNSK